MVLESDKKDKERGYNLTPSSYSINSTSSTNPIKSVSASLFEHKPKVATHPLDDLTEREIKKAVSLIQIELGNERLGFCSLLLKEPSKELVQKFESNPNEYVPREALAVVLDNVEEKTYEVVVALSPEGEERVLSCVHIPEVQPPILSSEYELCEDIVKRDPRIIAFLKKRGIKRKVKIMVDLWIGFFSHPQNRIGKPLLFYRSSDDENGYARPIDGLEVTVDLNKMEVTEVRELFEVPIPPFDANSQWQQLPPSTRPPLKPIEISQPEGVSFQVDGQKISWQNWSFRVTFNKREGIVFHRIAYTDKGKDRPIIYRASIAEMVVPYGDPRHPNYSKNAFDAGEDGLGVGVHSLELGCDCLGVIHYLDVVLCDGHGVPSVVKNAICIHEEDVGLGWKHKDWRTGVSQTRRQRRLVVSFFTTIANYDYGFYWYFYLDGTIKCEAKLTGIMSTSAIKDGESPQGYGVPIAPNLYAPIHQHFFTARLDMQVDGFNNYVEEINVKVPEAHEYNPYKSAFYATKTPFKRESEAQRNANTESARYWRIVNTKTTNRHGEQCAWRLVPLNVTFPFAGPESAIMFKAAHLNYTLWVTPFDEKYPAGNYTIQKVVDDGLSKWTKQDRNIYDTNVVVWLNFGITHVTRVEDWPVMPVEYCGFVLKPDNFFDLNPSMDVPLVKSTHSQCAHPKAKL